MASSNPWEPVQPTAAGLMLARAVSAGVVSQVGRLDGLDLHYLFPDSSNWLQSNRFKSMVNVVCCKDLLPNRKMIQQSFQAIDFTFDTAIQRREKLKRIQGTLDIYGKPSACFAHFSEAEQIADLQAEVSRINLETEALQMEKDTADITHPFYLTQKCQALQAMNRHLDGVLKDKRTLRQRLVKPLCRESLPIEAAFHRDVVELLVLAVAFIEKLETHLLTVRSIPQIPENIKNMSSALAKMDLLVTETEELAEQILEWREKQKGIFENSQLTAGLDSSFKSIR